MMRRITVIVGLAFAACQVEDPIDGVAARLVSAVCRDDRWLAHAIVQSLPEREQHELVEAVIPLHTWPLDSHCDAQLEVLSLAVAVPAGDRGAFMADLGEILGNFWQGGRTILQHLQQVQPGERSRAAVRIRELRKVTSDFTPSLKTVRMLTQWDEDTASRHIAAVRARPVHAAAMEMFLPYAAALERDCPHLLDSSSYMAGADVMAFVGAQPPDMWDSMVAPMLFMHRRTATSLHDLWTFLQNIPQAKRMSVARGLVHFSRWSDVASMTRLGDALAAADPDEVEALATLVTSHGSQDSLQAAVSVIADLAAVPRYERTAILTHAARISHDHIAEAVRLMRDIPVAEREALHDCCYLMSRNGYNDRLSIVQLLISLPADDRLTFTLHAWVAEARDHAQLSFALRAWNAGVRDLNHMVQGREEGIIVPPRTPAGWLEGPLLPADPQPDGPLNRENVMDLRRRAQAGETDQPVVPANPELYWPVDRENVMDLGRRAQAEANIHVLRELYPHARPSLTLIPDIIADIEDLRRTSSPDNSAWTERGGHDEFTNAILALRGYTAHRFTNFASFDANENTRLTDGTTLHTQDALALVWTALQEFPNHAVRAYDTVADREVDRANLRWSIFKALAEVIDDDGHRVCAVGKITRLAFALAGYIRGIQICDAPATGSQIFTQMINAFRNDLRQEALAAGTPMLMPEAHPDDLSTPLPIPPEPSWERLHTWLMEAAAMIPQLLPEQRAAFVADLRAYLELSGDEQVETFLRDNPNFP